MGPRAGLLGPKLAQVIGALEPGGGDPYEGLNDVERKSLEDLFEVTGFPQRALWRIGRPTDVSAVAPNFIMRLADPEWVEDFWTVRGYAGADGELADRLVDEKLVISEVLLQVPDERQPLLSPAKSATAKVGNYPDPGPE